MVWELSSLTSFADCIHRYTKIVGNLFYVHHVISFPLQKDGCVIYYAREILSIRFFLFLSQCLHTLNFWYSVLRSYRRRHKWTKVQKKISQNLGFIVFSRKIILLFHTCKVKNQPQTSVWDWFVWLHFTYIYQLLQGSLYKYVSPFWFSTILE